MRSRSTRRTAVYGMVEGLEARRHFAVTPFASVDADVPASLVRRAPVTALLTDRGRIFLPDPDPVVADADQMGSDAVRFGFRMEGTGGATSPALPVSRAQWRALGAAALQVTDPDGQARAVTFERVEPDVRRADDPVTSSPLPHTAFFRIAPADGQSVGVEDVGGYLVSLKPGILPTGGIPTFPTGGPLGSFGVYEPTAGSEAEAETPSYAMTVAARIPQGTGSRSKLNLAVAVRNQSEGPTSGFGTVNVFLDGPPGAFLNGDTLLIASASVDTAALRPEGPARRVAFRPKPTLPAMTVPGRYTVRVEFVPPPTIFGYASEASVLVNGPAFDFTPNPNAARVGVTVVEPVGTFDRGGPGPDERGGVANVIVTNTGTRLLNGKVAIDLALASTADFEPVDALLASHPVKLKLKPGESAVVAGIAFAIPVFVDLGANFLRANISPGSPAIAADEPLVTPVVVI